MVALASSFNVHVVNSCKFLSVTAMRYDNNSTSADIEIINMETGDSNTFNMAYGASGQGQVHIPLSSDSNGVYRVCLHEGGFSYICIPIMIHCDIDCCLTKLTNELLDCACDCPKCSSALAKAQKIFLLLKSAESAVEIAQSGTTISRSVGYFTDILLKYKKAKEICDNSCGCDC